MLRVARHAAGRLLHRLAPPQGWLPVPLDPPAAFPTTISLRAEGRRADPPSGLSVASLRPLLFVAGWPRSGAREPARTLTADLTVDGASRSLAGLELTLREPLHVNGAPLGIYQIAGMFDRSQTPIERWITHRRFAAQATDQADQHNFIMAPRDLEALHVFYLRARPVVMVSVSDGAGANLFPMDLIGPVGDNLFTMALRAVSPSTATMTNAGKWAFGGVPFSRRQTAYDLGKHHKEKFIDIDALGIDTRATEISGLPLPAWSLTVHEVELIEAHPAGSHILFVTRIRSRSRWHRGPQFHHTSRSLATWLGRHGRPSLASAP